MGLLLGHFLGVLLLYGIDPQIAHVIEQSRISRTKQSFFPLRSVEE